jgi:hypothetical protein
MTNEEKANLINRADAAFELGKQEREYLIDLGIDAYEAELSIEEFASILKEGGYNPITAKEYAERYLELAEPSEEESEDEEEEES